MSPAPGESRRRIVVGVTGSIAAFKAVALVSQLVQRDHDVVVVLTASAAKMISRATFQAITAGPVIEDLWGEIGDTHMGPDSRPMRKFEYFIGLFLQL